jgi:hypothetical protein
VFNNEQFRTVIVKPVLQALQLLTPVAEELLVATMAHESKGGTFLVEEKGAALGIYQMLPKEHDDLWLKFMPNQSETTHRLMQVCKMSTKPTSDMMVFNLLYATAMARIFYLDCKAALPASADIDSLWPYYKKWWNTEAGKATEEEFKQDYFNFIGKGNSDGKKQRKA